MSRKANPATVGGFVLGAALLAIGSVIFFTSGALFRDSQDYIAYFPGSLSGLEVGAPVTFRGVRIGSVKEILAIYDLGTDEIFLPVVFEIEDDRFDPVGNLSDSSVDFDDNDAVVQSLFQQGLRARLELRSILTGQLSIGLDMHPDSPLELTDRKDRRLVEFPTLPTDIEQFRVWLNDFLNDMGDVDLGEIVENVNGALQGIDSLVNSEHLQATLSGMDELANSEDLRQALASLKTSLQSFDRAMASIRTLATNTDARVGSITDVMVDAARELQAMLENAESALTGLERSMSADSDLRARTTRAMEELGRAAGAVRSLADYLERHPEALIRGKAKDGGTQ